MTDPEGRLFTPLFFVMCSFSFTVFFAAFLVFPTAPFRVLALGGDTFAAGLFLAFLTYASALSAPLTGAVADRLGKRRVLFGASLMVACFHLAYGFSGHYRPMLVLALLHGFFWSGLLSASSAYLTDITPDSRRAEALGYWGLATIAAVLVAPTAAFILYDRGWWVLCLTAAALNVVMAGIALRLRERQAPPAGASAPRRILEWRVLLASLTLFLYSFGYGGLTSFSALYADRSGVTPRGLYYSVMAGGILATRPILLPLASRVGHRRFFLGSLGLVVVALLVLVAGGSRAHLVVSALLYAVGFGNAYAVYASHVMRHVNPARRGAAFGSMIAAFDTGIGTGSLAMGWLIQAHGFRTAFAVAAGLASLAGPYFVFAERRFLAPSPTAG
jgi:MFS family permease